MHLRLSQSRHTNLFAGLSVGLGLALLLAFGWSPAALAQGATTGALSGVVTDEEGAQALPGVAVTAIHQPTGTVYSATTRDDGRFLIANVRPGGPYTVSVALDGFRPQEQSDVSVNLGEDQNLTFKLQLAGIEESINVVGESSTLINPSKTGASSNIGEEAIVTLPTINRGLEDFARTNPLVTLTSTNEDAESISVAGRNNRYNNIQIDGAVNNDLFGLAASGTPGGQAATGPISLDAIQEIQVLVAPYDVRQGGFSGGGINAITRSGTNQFKGSVFAFSRDESFVGDGPDRLGKFGTFEEEQYGFRVGGPIQRDKIFFFVNAEQGDKTEPTGWSLDGSSGQQFTNGNAQPAAELFRNTLIQRYGFDPGGFSQNSRDTPSTKAFARFDFNLGTSHNLTLRHNYVDAESDINRPSATVYEWPSETYFFVNETNSTVAQLNSTFGSNLFNEARVSYQTIKDRRTPRDGLVFPWIEIENVPLVGNPNPLTGVEFEVGSENFSTHNSLDQDIIELTDDLTWIKGNHTLTIGTHNEFFTFDNLFIQNGFGAYEFRTLDDFVQNRPARVYNFSFVNAGQSPSQKFDVQQLGLYGGDQWALRSNLTLTYGLRVDVPFFPDEPSRNPLTETLYGFRTDELPDGKEMISPRVGFNWDIGGQGKQQLRGGVGIFSGRTPYVWIANTYARTGIEQTFITANNVPFNPDPNNQPRNVGNAAFGEFNLIDPDFEFPQVLRTSLGYDIQLPWLGLVASIEAVYADSLKEIAYRDVNLVPTGNTLPFDGRPTFRRLDSRISGAYLITNTSEGEQTNVSVKLERPYRDGWSSFVSYSYGDAKVVIDGTSSRAVSNFQFLEATNPNDPPLSTSDFEVEHRFNASVSYRFNRNSDWATTVSAFYNLQSGRPFSYIFGSQPGGGGINGDNYFSNDLLYVPATADDVIITGGGTWAQLDAFISQDECLDDHRGGIAPRNCARAPWNHSLDLHVAQDIPISRTDLQITFDMLNVMNLFDQDSGVFRYANFEAVSPVAFVGTDAATGKPIYSLNSVVRNPQTTNRFNFHNVNSRWRAKIGLRWSF